MELYSDIGTLKGVGEKTKEQLNKCGIFNILDLLLYFPRDYESLIFAEQISGKTSNSKVVLKCTVIKIEKDFRTKNGKVISTIVFKNGDKLIRGKWFNQPYIKNKFKLSMEYTLSGKIEDFNGEIIISNPVAVNYDNLKVENKNSIIPKYPLKGGVTNNLIIKLITQVIDDIEVKENLPDWIIDKYNLCSLDKAIVNIHKPQNLENLHEARTRLKFQELLSYSLKLLMLKEKMKINNSGIALRISPELNLLKEQLPFELTDAQSKAVKEILMDQKKGVQMNRLVQGDVGSGKTIVAIISMFNVVKNGYQAVLMAPTEILANRHYLEFCKILADFDINIKILSGSTTKKEKEILKKDLKNGNIDIIIGTHALIEDNVEFKKLAMVVTDEQHRFGVMQRSKLFNKAENVHMLVMTATPIPRTLALYLYGDLDVSIINQLPPGRQKIETYYIDTTKKDRAYNFALKEIEKGRQVYIVCPLVEENEELELSSVQSLYVELKSKYFSNIEIGILHGKMTNKDKEEIMERFKSGIVKALVATTVIEVGINVPNATLMLIENAERFGLAQLRQLRGRVGRGNFKSYCILIAEIKNNKIKKRMEIMKNSNDGFFIAEEDLKIRGSGEMFGFRQHGEEDLILSDFLEDIDILSKANNEAKRLISSKDSHDRSVLNEIMKRIENSSRLICFN